MIKNLTGQRWTVFAFDATTGLPETGDAANITANLRLDGGAANAVDDTNPTELEDGYYIFDLTQAETNADHIIICPQSSTTDIVVIGVPGAVWTTPAKQAATLAAADVTGNLPANVAQWKGATAPDNTGDAFARLGANGAGLTALPTAVQIRTEMDNNSTKLANLDATTSSRLASASYTAPPTAAAIRGEIDSNSTKLDVAIGTRLAAASYTAPANADIAAIKAKTDNLPAVPAAVGSEMTLTAAYDAAKTAASQSSVNSIPTNPLLTNDARLNNLNATIASRLAADNYTAPANDNITAIKAVTDKLDDTLELADGKNRFTEAALAEGPAADVSAVVDDLVDSFLDAQLTGHDIVGSVGAAIAASSASGDPWTTELPGTYAAGTAGNIIGTKTASAEEIREELDTRSSKFSILGRILKF